MQYSIMAKPAGARCNLACDYCYYREKSALHRGAPERMSLELMADFIAQHILMHPPGTPVEFAWQGGEPLLLGIDYFNEIFALQQHFAKDHTVTNTIQTNATLITPQWADLLAEQQVLTGVSLDGPAHIHNIYRKNPDGRGSFDDVTAGIGHLKKAGVQYNLLATVGDHNICDPVETYEFLKQVGQGFVQFIPLVERRAGTRSRQLGLELDLPAGLSRQNEPTPVTPWSAEPDAWGQFLVTLFDHWVSRDVGTVFIQLFDATLANHLGAPPVVCYHSRYCGGAGVLEADGTLYCCDHFVYPETRLGNIKETSLEELMTDGRQDRFGRAKTHFLPQYCLGCDVIHLCNGECPKNRFAHAPDGSPGLNWLCSGYRRFFRHSAPDMQRMAQLVHDGRPASDIIQEK